MSGSPSSLVYNHFLADIKATSDDKGRGRSRACADGLGACLSVIYLRYMLGPLFAALKLANLLLHLQVCFIVPCKQGRSGGISHRLVGNNERRPDGNGTLRSDGRAL